MTNRIRENIEVIDNAVAGRRAIVRVPVGRSVLDAHIDHAGVTLEQMENIKVILVAPTRTVTLWEFETGVELNELNKRYFRNVEAGKLSFYFRRPELETEEARMLTALGTDGLQQVKIEFDIDAAATPNISAHGKFSANRHISKSLLTYTLANNDGGNAEGVNFYDDIDRRDRIAAVHVLNNAVDAAKLTINGTSVHEMTRARNEFDEKGSPQGRIPYAADYGLAIDFLTSGRIDETLQMDDPNFPVNRMRLTSTLGNGADSRVRILVEYLTTWRSLTAS